MAQEAFTDIRVERDGPVSILTICRSQARNALRKQSLVEMIEAVRQETARGARALVITGEGEHFSSGADLKEMRADSVPVKEENLTRRWGPMLNGIESGPIPAIAAVRGYAVAGGTELALACHLRVLGRSAKLGLTEIRQGHIPGGGGTVRLPRMIGTGPALQYLLTGDTMDADEALRFGLANAVVEDDEVTAHAVEFGKRIARLSPKAVELTLRSVIAQRDLPLADALAFEIELCREMRKSPDYHEGLDAFIAKREPRYGTKGSPENA
ncbi:MAG: enoyl-CoA hydratase/isomerase family protein [Betaproteobacteria bacterium]|nr:enoyl-CoA hydratase/isomerase family protein [Betaproteobacteria bacterium]